MVWGAWAIGIAIEWEGGRKLDFRQPWGGGGRGLQNCRTDFENPVIRPVFHR